MPGFSLPIGEITSLAPERYAVIDGGSIFDLPDEIERAKLTAWPLYLECDDETAAAGPFMVTLPDKSAVEAVVEIIGDSPAATFWSWPGGPNTFLQHLRGCMMFAVDRTDGTEFMLVRLGDPRTLAMIVPVLTPSQLATLLGDARGTLLYADDGHPIIVRSEGNIRSASRIHLSPEQYREIEHRYGDVLRKQAIERMSPRLREPPAEAKSRILDAFDRAENYGLSEPEDILRFIALDIETEHRFEYTTDFDEVRAILSEASTAPGIKLFHVERRISDIRARRGASWRSPA